MNIKFLGAKSIYKGRIFELKRVRMKAPDGHHFQHDVLFHPGAAVIIPLLGRNHVVLIKQYRAAVRKAIWEFPAGTLEKGEAPLTCAKREVIEEAGFEAKRWKKLVSFYPAPGISTEYMHIYLASKLTPKPTRLDRDEYLEKHVVSIPDLQKMIFSGKIIDAKTIISFFYLLQDRNSVKGVGKH